MALGAAQLDLRRLARERPAWAILASLISTAKLNRVDPAVYLGDVLTRMVGGATPINRIADLLVWNWKAARASPTPAAA